MRAPAESSWVCHSIDADAAFAQGSCEMLDQGIDDTLGAA